MKTGTLVTPTQPIPTRLQEALHTYFPDKTLSELTIRYYANVEDVGYEYFMETVLPTCNNGAAVHYLAPFISFVRLGEARILDGEGTVIYETDENDFCTETGPFWYVTPKAP